MVETRLVELLNELSALGFERQLSSRSDGRIWCSGCEVQTSADRWTIEEVRRLEGETDPADELIVLGLRDPEGPCDCRGTLILGYGPNSSREDVAVLSRLKMDEVRAVGH